MADYNDPIQAYLQSIGAAPGVQPGMPQTPSSVPPQPQPAAPPQGILSGLTPYAQAIVDAIKGTPPAYSPAGGMDYTRSAGWGNPAPPSYDPLSSIRTPSPPAYDPLSSIQTPPGPLAIPPSVAAHTARPASPTIAASGAAAPPKKRIDPAKVDLGQNPRFRTLQYQQPHGPMATNPIITALNLGGSS